MSLLHNTGVYQSTNKTADLKHRDYEYRDATGAVAGFILTLVCMALALVVASVVFTPVPVGSGINDEISFVGP